MLYIGGAISSGNAHSSRVRSSWLRDIRLLPSANRPSISQASAIITAPVVVMVSETVWIRDGRLSSRTPNDGSCTTGRAPAPSAPIAISTVPVAPNRRVRRSATIWASLSGEPSVRFVAVPAGDRRAEGLEAPGVGHHSRVTVGAMVPFTLTVRVPLLYRVSEFRHNGVVEFDREQLRT